MGRQLATLRVALAVEQHVLLLWLTVAIFAQGTYAPEGEPGSAIPRVHGARHGPPRGEEHERRLGHLSGRPDQAHGHVGRWRFLQGWVGRSKMDVGRTRTKHARDIVAGGGVPADKTAT